MYEIIQRGEAMERAGELLILSACAGFTAADIFEIGPSVCVTVDCKNPKHRITTSTTTSTNDDEQYHHRQQARDYAQQIAEECIDYCWKTRKYKSEQHLSVAAAASRARHYLTVEYPVHHKPMVIADVTDNPGSGHYGDATNLLQEIIGQRLPDVIFYAIYDPEAVRQGEAIGVGRTGTITLGGKTALKITSGSSGVGLGGPPLVLTGRVVALTDGCFQTFGPMGFGGLWQNFGLSMVFRPADSSVDVIVISNNGQLLDLAQMTSMGCDLSNKVSALPCVV